MAEPVTIIGISLKGKNRVREHGNSWRAIKFGNPQCFDGQDAVKLEAPDGYTRWVKLHEDRDFRMA